MRIKTPLAKCVLRARLFLRLVCTSAASAHTRTPVNQCDLIVFFFPSVYRSAAVESVKSSFRASCALLRACFARNREAPSSHLRLLSSPRRSIASRDRDGEGGGEQKSKSTNCRDRPLDEYVMYAAIEQKASGVDFRSATGLRISPIARSSAECAWSSTDI